MMLENETRLSKPALSKRNTPTLGKHKASTRDRSRSDFVYSSSLQQSLQEVESRRATVRSEMRGEEKRPVEMR